MKNKILEGITFTKTHVNFHHGTSGSIMEIGTYLEFVRNMKKNDKTVRKLLYKEKQRIKSKARLK